MTATRHLRILAFGASLTEGFCSDGSVFHPYTIRLSQLLRSSYEMVDIHNAGVSGEAVLSAQMLPRLKQLLSSSSSEKKFDWVLILAGTNDAIRDQQKASLIFNTYKLLVNECRQHGARVLVMTLPETIFPREFPMDFQRQEFNRLLKEELVSKNNDTIVLLDVDRLLPRHSLSQNELRQIWDDELHLTPQGYDRLGQFIYETLQPYLS